MPSHQVRRHSLHLPHIVVQNSLLAAIIPLDGHTCPIRFCDGAAVGWIGVPADEGADLELSGLFAGHLDSSVRTPLKFLFLRL